MQSLWKRKSSDWRKFPPPPVPPIPSLPRDSVQLDNRGSSLGGKSIRRESVFHGNGKSRTGSYWLGFLQYRSSLIFNPHGARSLNGSAIATLDMLGTLPLIDLESSEI
ncbi:hypothetical protein M9H77_00138 [Catharanthus roseus]|nr:hypothetical protein M9H77_00133 [Catharanthus roseus]KAI5640977.1 hypothetical protein M9H77_00138 [Catharanthus roseus]